MKLRGLVPKFHIHVSASVYIFIRSVAYFATKYVDRSWEYVNRSQIHECGNWERGRAVSFLEIDKSDLVGSVYIGELQLSVQFKFGVD
jgi:hypothetical protein